MSQAPKLSRRNFFIATAALATTAATGVALTTSNTAAQTASATQRYLEGDLALGGYDPVAYFSNGKPTPGSADVSADWDNATWRFSSEANKQAFLANPEKYAPQYGGFCAYAVSQGYTASADPQAWSIVDDKLYVNFNKAVRGLWNLRRSHYIKEGDKNWPGVLNG